MIHAAFITHLQGAGLTAPVKNAFTANPVEDYDADFPVVMVYPTQDSFSENEADNFSIQQQTTRIDALIGCLLSDLDTHVEEFRSASQGWGPGGNWDDMELVGGNVEGLKGGYIWWRESVTVQRSRRQTL
jgi:hypothetical protein